jgi:hypothetical protein
MLIEKIPVNGIREMALQFMQLVWKGEVPSVYDGEESFENDLRNYKVPLHAFSSFEDPERIPLYRCRDCKSTNVYSSHWKALNWPRKIEETENNDQYLCVSCAKNRGDGIIKYLDEFDPETGAWS